MTDFEPPIEQEHEPPERERSRVRSDLVVGILLVAVLALAAYLRFTGLNWDSGTHLHPDERFLTMVETSIQPPQSIGEYFNTETSPLNPHNAGHGFFVYGTFPIFLVRYLAEWTGMSGYDEVHLLGRAVSGISDLVSILLIYLIGERLFNRRVGILAALFTTLSVLLIQHAHFFVVDPLANVFILAGLYFSVRVIGEGKISDYLLFGVMLGLAVASKISAAPLAVAVALAGLTNILKAPSDQRSAVISRTLVFLFAAALMSLLIFRVFQPYAFEGPGFLNVKFNPKWLANMAEVRSQQAGNTDAPYALQWADRAPVFFSLNNLILWGMGIPLAILGWIGLGWAIVEMIRGRWERYLILVVWTAGMFIWQSVNFTKAMRYQLPIYPTLALLAAWVLCFAWESVPKLKDQWQKAARVGVLLVGLVTVLGTALWAFAFHSIYSVPLTRVSASRWIYRNIPAAVNLVGEADGETLYETIPVPIPFDLDSGDTYTTEISTDVSAVISGVLLPYVSTGDGQGGALGISVTLADEPHGGDVYARGEYQGEVRAGEEVRVEIQLDRSFSIDPDTRLFLILENTGSPSLHMRPTVLVHETTWDDGLPWGVDGRGLGGRYEVQNLELYWHDNQDDDDNGIPDKLERIVEYLEQGDYLTISSNRQYGTIPRVPIRYPLTSAYYRELFGCPDGMDVPTCGATAEVGLYDGRLGYSLVEVFESHPSIGSLEINDQFAEEAFTVYDHPKVLIFKRDADFSAEKVFDILSRVDVSGVVHVLPKDAGDTVGKDLLLSTDQWQRQQDEGTWSELFNTESIVNRSGLLSAIVWWVALGVLGLLVYPITRVVFRRFHDGGYALSRLIGLLLFSWGAWIFGSLGITVSRLTLFIVLLLLAGVSFALAWRDREELSTFFRTQWRDILWVEVFALSFFLLDLAIRFGNPDLWHPAKGGEKPMDFSYLNAVIKSSTFPPYDPWFAGGYINYYYYGFVLVGMPVKLLGIIPATAYNLIIPTLFSTLALCAYSVGYHLVRPFSQNVSLRARANPKLAGLVAALLLVVFGNLGTARMFYDGFKQIGTPAGVEEGRYFVGAGQAAKGFVNYLTVKSPLPYPMDQWYWNPSRMITPGEGEPGPITEFPFFTFLYADLHAHMISRSLTILSIAWGLSWILSVTQRRRRGKIDIALTLFVGGLTFGALRLVNTWDFPVYWVLGVLAIIFAVWWRDREFYLPQIAEAALYSILLIAFSQFLYQPFHQWYGQGYMSAEIWKGSLTPLIDYLTVHGVFLFLFAAWMAWETREWLAQTPISELNRLRPIAMWIGSAVFLIVVGTIWLVGVGYQIALIVIPLGVWALMLLLRPGLPIGKQIVLFFVGTGLVLTFVVEVVVLKGDIGRMNTVFKFYLQVWELFSLAAAAALAWTYASLPKWNRVWRWIWLTATVLLLFSAALYPLTGSLAKVRDRMTITAPRTLDGMLYMDYAYRFELGEKLPLGEDYQAIRWLQENVEGSPVIVEANIPEYRWGSRYSIYTGLPGVLGWRWHQTQQRVAAENTDVDERLFQITKFYLTQSIAEANDFLDEYNVKYVIVGGLERAYYAEVYPCWPEVSIPGISCDLRGWPLGMPTSFSISPDECELERPGDETSSLRCPTHALDKFQAMESAGRLKAVFQVGNTVIYEVLR
ncbi:MAG: DUF2298 domain-containing protein [Chloroflexota bacterium]|nr:DUF2298 domain-containing protein [Chloroflexota bacterium]